MPRANRPGSRRLELSLPAGHPIWSLPPRSRAAYARALLDLGFAVESRLAKIEERLAAIEKRLGRAPILPEAGAGAQGAGAEHAGEGAPGGGSEARGPRGGAKVDVASFLAAFDE